MKKNKWLLKNCDSLKGRRVVVTGATGGLGREICFHLASLGANIILACRSEEKANNLIAEIKEKHANIEVDFVELNLSKFESVKSFIKKVKAYNGIDVLVNNAGVYNVPVEPLDSGFNNIFQVNFVYTYYLTKQLLSELEKKENSVCVTLGSIAHNYSKLDENDVDFSSRKKPSKIYGNSKRFLMFSLYELFKNSTVKLAIVHPGITLTNMTNHYPKTINWLVKIGIKILFQSPEKAALCVLFGIKNCTSYHEWVGPKIFDIWGRPKLKKLKTCKMQESEKIFEIAESIYKEVDQ